MTGVSHGEQGWEWLSIKELRLLLATHEVSAVEIAEAFLERLDDLGRPLNAVSELLPEVGRSQAEQADRILRTPAAEALSLCGIPYGAKDLIETKGIPTRWGLPWLRDRRGALDATVIERLEAAGAVLLAKLAMVSLAGAGNYTSTSASADGAGINPWSAGHWSGGSSSGSASAVAAGLLPFALGSETGGSIIVPAAFCGLSGFRPSIGAVSKFGCMSVSWTMDKIGPLARTAEDCEVVYEAIAGADPRDPLTYFSTTHEPKRASLRLGILPLDAANATTHAFQSALGVLTEFATTDEVSSSLSGLHEIYEAVVAGECATAHGELLKSEELENLPDATQRQGLRDYLQVPLPKYVRALELRVAAAHEIRRLFEEFDVLVAPTLGDGAPLIGDDLGVWQTQNRHYGVFGALAGLPGLSVPMGFTPDNMPLGLSFIGDVGADLTVLGVGQLYQSRTDWHSYHPNPQINARGLSLPLPRSPTP